MIEVVNVTKKFGDFTAIQDLNFKVSDGSIYGLIGYNGAGKTTLLKTITGVYKPDGGEVRLDGENAFDNAKMKQHMFMCLMTFISLRMLIWKKWLSFITAFILTSALTHSESYRRCSVLTQKHALTDFQRACKGRRR